MQNPLQTTYSVEELFRLKPETIAFIAPPQANDITPTSLSQVNELAASHELLPTFWSQYKTYLIVGGVLLVAGTAIYWYKKRQKDKENLAI